MSETTVDDRKFRAIVDRLRVAQEPRLAALKSQGELFIDEVDRRTPRDTNRLIRGWYQAANDADLTYRPLPPLSPSSRREKWLEVLREQVAYWEAEVAEQTRYITLYEEEDAKSPLTKTGRKRKRRTSQPFYRKMVRLRRRAEKRLTRATEELNKALETEAIVLVDQGRFGADVRGYKAGRKAFTKSGLRKLTTVRDRIYGGSGSIERVGRLLILTLHNLEFHASFVERMARFGHPVRTAKMIVRQAGGRTMTRAFIKKAQEEVDAARRAA